jgi:hypothetical protein
LGLLFVFFYAYICGAGQRIQRHDKIFKSFSAVINKIIFQLGFSWLVTDMAGAWPTFSMIFQIAGVLWGISYFFPPPGNRPNPASLLAC